MKFSHNEIRALIPRYRERAQELYPQVSVNNWGDVQIVEDGAYVECNVWVSKEDLEITLLRKNDD